MITCGKECYPCCDFCIWAKHYNFITNEKVIKSGVEGCEKHPEEHYQSMARSLGYCKDFHCRKVNIKEEH